jgi:hypothetical protein
MPGPLCRHAEAHFAPRSTESGPSGILAGICVVKQSETNTPKDWQVRSVDMLRRILRRGLQKADRHQSGVKLRCGIKRTIYAPAEQVEHKPLSSPAQRDKV